MTAPPPRALVTGAGGAIGTAVVTALRRRGHLVLALDPRQPTSVPDGVWWLPQRLGGLDHRELPDTGGPIQHSFLVAGGALPEEADLGVGGHLSRAALRQTIEDNLVAAMDGIEIARNAWAPQGDIAFGSITLASSINARAPYGLPAYSACKAALAGLTIALAAEVAREGLRLNCIELGTVEHEGVAALHAGDPGHFRRLRRASPTGRLMTPDEAAAALVAIGLDQQSLIGQVIAVDRGQSVSIAH